VVETGNVLLDALTEERRASILAHSKEIDMPRGDLAFEVGRRITHVHFPIDAVASLVVVTKDGSSVEAAMQGREGLVGLPVALGRRAWPAARAIIQVPGRALVMSADDFVASLADDGKLTDLVQGLTLTLMTEIAQTVACNRLHPADERLARWLSRARDAAQRDVLPLTQEFIAEMLGVRRATVTVAARTLQDDGLIQYRRGRITIEDLDRLHERACECYEVIKRQYRELYAPDI
jgi:CRP-like cAMP-binding protein